MLQREGQWPGTGRGRSRSRSRVAGAVLLAAAVAASVAGCSTSASTAASVAAVPAVATSTGTPTRTQVQVVEVWKGSAPAPGVTVTGTASGHCFAPSIATTRHDAYRCLTGNLIYDPCFAPQTTPPGSQVLCVEGPSVSRLLKVTLTAPLPAGGTGTPQVAPFALMLADGQFCLRNSGAERATSSLPLSYTCPGGDLFGFPDTSAAVWTIRYQPSSGGALTAAAIATAYR
jgi:hypothetical protein